MEVRTNGWVVDGIIIDIGVAKSLLILSVFFTIGMASHGAFILLLGMVLVLVPVPGLGPCLLWTGL